MPGGNNPNNSVGEGWHLTHNIIQQIYSYSANSGKKFDEAKRNPNIKCKDNKLIFESMVNLDGKSNQIDTGILFSEMMSYLLSKPKNRDDNSYNTRTTLPQIKNEDSRELNEENNDNQMNHSISLKYVDLPKNKGKKKSSKRKNIKKTHYYDNYQL